MRQFQTSVLERREEIDGPFTSQPFEAAWASEAIYFIAIEAIEGRGARLDAHAQISADGIRWMDEGSALADIDREGNRFLRVRHFGGWLRLRLSVRGQGARFKVTVHLVLKE